MAEIDQPRFLNDVISTSSSGVNIETGLLSPSRCGLATTSLGRSPTPTDGCSEVGSFSEQVWGDPRERGHGSQSLPAHRSALSLGGRVSELAMHPVATPRQFRVRWVQIVVGRSHRPTVVDRVAADRQVWVTRRSQVLRALRTGYRLTAHTETVASAR
jgi:hypothetical protein